MAGRLLSGALIQSRVTRTVRKCNFLLHLKTPAYNSGILANCNGDVSPRLSQDTVANFLFLIIIAKHTSKNALNSNNSKRVLIFLASGGVELLSNL
jgi:hypothetical protein